MTPEVLFLVNTIAQWAGWGFLFWTLVLAVRYWFNHIPIKRSATLKAMVQSGILSAVMLLIAVSTPHALGKEVSGMYLPLVWVLMPFPGWLAAAAVIFVGYRLVGACVALNDAERKNRILSAVVWLLVGVGSVFWFPMFEKPVKIFRGAMPITPMGLGLVVVCAFLAVVAMVATERAVRARTLAKTTITHVVLLVGCVVFGMPFVWLLITSFKEDRDMASAEGIVWVPKVQQTVPYDDPKKPMVETTFQGQHVRAVVDTSKTVPGGPLTLEVDRPLGLRGRSFTAKDSDVKPVMGEANLVLIPFEGKEVRGFIAEDKPDGSQVIEILVPQNLKGKRVDVGPNVSQPYRLPGLRWKNYIDCLEWLPEETNFGLLYLKNTLFLVFMNVLGTVFSCSIVAYAFSRMRFPGRNFLFMVMLSTMMLPGAVTMLPGFLINRSLGWIDTLYPLWVGSFFAGAFNVFLLKQFFSTIPMELEDAAKIDGCSYIRTYWQVMLPQIKPALTVIAIWTFMGTWNNFMGPLIYLSSPEKMPIAYAVQLFQNSRGGEQGLMMAFATMSLMPVLALFFFAQRYFIEGVQLSGLGGR